MRKDVREARTEEELKKNPANTIIIVEGEMDKLALEMAGYLNVLSVPGGERSRRGTMRSCCMCFMGYVVHVPSCLQLHVMG